jgi:uncharacterized membrane protein YgcG
VRKLLVVLAATVFAVWWGSPAYAADEVDNAIAAFKNGAHVYVAPSGTSDKINKARVEQAVGNRSVLIAVLPDGTSPSEAARRIGTTVRGRLVAGVVAGRQFEAGSTYLCAGAANAAASAATNAHRAQLQRDSDVTDTLVDFVSRVDSAPSSNCRSSGSSAGASGGQSSGGGHTGELVLAGLVGVGAVGGGAYMVSRRRKKQRELDDLRAEVTSLYDRLGADVSNIDTKDNATARQALADASERYNAAGAQLAGADSPGKFQTARRTALEGLYAARTARKELGLSEGPELPPLYPAGGQAMAEPTTVTVRGQQVQGYPDYQPGAPYWYGGGGGYGAGWYSMPFWETLLLTGAVTSMFGHNDFGYGYQEGYEDARDQTGGSDQGWGGGGGDWGGGGGGDWGGGGGDWGGGGDSGGSW